MLKYKHPYTEVRIFDNSEVGEEVSGGGTPIFLPFFSERGPDNKLININRDVPRGRYAFGTRNWKRYGQHIYNMYQWLDGGGVVWGIRLMPTDATYANLVLNIKTKAVQLPLYEKDSDGNYVVDKDNNRIPVMDTSDPLNPVPVTVPGVDVKHELLYLDKITLLDTIEERLETLSTTTPNDAEGYKNHYLAAFFVMGRGKYGNRQTISININKLYEATYDFRVYNITIMERTIEGDMRIIDGPFEFSFFPEAIALTRNSMHLNKVLEDYSEHLRVVFSDEVYDKLIDDILAATKDPLTNENTMSPNTIDFIAGVDKDGILYERLAINPNSVMLDYYEGSNLLGGSDGGIDPKEKHIRIDVNGDPVLDPLTNLPIYDNNTATYVRSVMDKLLLNAYRGVIAPEVFNTTFYEFDVIMDANNSNPVKYAMVQFARERGDIFCYIDSGFQASVSTSIRWRRKDFQTNDYSVSIQAQAMTYEDPDTEEIIPVTPCFYLSYMVPRNDELYGCHQAVAGPKRGIIENYKSVNWFPNELQKEDLYDAKMNYFEQEKLYVCRMLQVTSQFRETALSREANVRVLKLMVRRVRKIVKRYYHDRTSPIVLNQIQEDIKQSLKEYVDCGALDRLKVVVSQTKYEKQRHIAHVYIEVVFNGFLERFLIDFNIERE